MKKIVFLICSFLVFNLSAQQKYSKVKINANSEGLQKLIQLGVGIDHGISKKDIFFISDFSERDIKIMREHGFAIEIMIDDVQKHYVEQNLKPMPSVEKNTGCFSNTSKEKWEQPSTPKNFKLGSMGGFYTYEQFLDEVDSMAAKFPNLITKKSQIGDFFTNEYRPIYWLKISDNPMIDETNEPEILYSAVHHAREPQPLSELVFYMWYLLENYSKDKEIKYLVENTELYFIPCLNPDGYKYNQSTHPNGGGMHRKNMRNIGSYNMGVDLNRNYSHGWGTTGISFDENSDVYPGTNAFSEPETQAMRWFCNQRDFVFAFNTHSYSNLLLYPFGSTYEEIPKDNDYFISFTNEMVKYNHYNNMESSGLYLASGDSDDYMYADDLINKPQIFAMTPETGSSFWPASTEIVGLCQEMFYPNLLLAYLAHSYYLVKDEGNQRIDNYSGNFYYSVNRIGIESEKVTVSIEPIEGISTVGEGTEFQLDLNENKKDSVSYVLLPDLKAGDKIRYVLKTDYGDRIVRDTIQKIFQHIDLQFSDNSNTMNNWKGDWFLTNSDYHSEYSSFTDSPFGNYQGYSTSNFELDSTIDLTNISNPVIQFYAKWNIEAGNDFCQFQVLQENDTNWLSQCGNFTKKGSGYLGSFQPAGEPVYDGFQSEWVLEEIDLSDYIGQKIKVRFQLKTDYGNESDGFYFDDFKVMYNHQVSTNSLMELKLDVRIIPNPTNSGAFLSFSRLISKGELKIITQSGNVIFTKKMDDVSSFLSIDTSKFTDGIYYIYLSDSEEMSQPQKLVIIH